MSIDSTYVHRISSQLNNFKKKSNGVFNFRCPYCGDSQKHKNKSRGYFFTKKSGLVYKCHNCGVGRSFGNFLKDHCSDIYDEYVMERYKSGLTGKGRNVADPVFKTEKPKFKKNLELENIASLNRKHPAIQYLQNRKIPENCFSSLYHAEEFCTCLLYTSPSPRD